MRGNSEKTRSEKFTTQLSDVQFFEPGNQFLIKSIYDECELTGGRREE
jgi:hypothetical protein